MRTRESGKCLKGYWTGWELIINMKNTYIFFFLVAYFFSFSVVSAEQIFHAEFDRHSMSLVEQCKYLYCIDNYQAKLETEKKSGNRAEITVINNFLNKEKEFVINKMRNNIVWITAKMKNLPENQRPKLINYVKSILNKEKIKIPFQIMDTAIEENETPIRGVDPFYEKYLKNRIRLILEFEKNPNEIKTIRKDEIIGHEIEGYNLFLTFDDGPIPGKTDRILDILKKYNVKVTFFLLGKEITSGKKRAENLIRRMKKEGHSIGHHGMNHAILDSNKLSTKDIINEIYIPKMLIEKITGETVRFFRSPYGRRNQRVLNILDIYNQTHILWNIDSMDWRKEMTPKTIVDHVTRLAHLYEGGIVLFHDFTGKIPSFLPQLLETLIDKGFNFNSFHDKF